MQDVEKELIQVASKLVEVEQERERLKSRLESLGSQYRALHQEGSQTGKKELLTEYLFGEDK